MGLKGKSDIWQAKTNRRRKIANGGRRANPRSVSLKRDIENGVDYFWARRPKPLHLK